ncbi:MAG TPA: ATP-binding cassette domain-containing protein [Paenibacillus sp.]
MSATFEIHNITKNDWNEESPTSKYLFSNISAEILQPDRIAIIGTSGQGKSTLLRMLALLEAPDQGDILLNKTSYTEMDSRIWRMQVCYVAQQAVMLPTTVEDNLKAVSSLHGIPYDQELANRLLNEMGLDYLDISKTATDLSGGEKQRISLIRSLMLRPSVLLLDEITASLDNNMAQKVEDVLLQWHLEEGTSLLWVTHDLEQARRISRRTWFMGNGTLLEDSLSASFYVEPATELARKFIQVPEGKVLV